MNKYGNIIKVLLKSRLSNKKEKYEKIFMRIVKMINKLIKYIIR